MSEPATREEFLELVRLSGVLDWDELEVYLKKRQAELPEDAVRTAEAMVKDRILTQFQTENLLRGKHKGFFLGNYKVLDRIGSGGMGQVYLCEHRLMQRRVAVKVLPALNAAKPEVLKRFEREARAGGALQHPNIVRAFDHGYADKVHFLVMEYLEGDPLGKLVKDRGPLSPERAADYIRQSAAGLQYASDAGLIHRDIKPDNLFLDRNGVVKILDLGLARFSQDESDVLTKGIVGTPDYLAPEQVKDSHSVDVRADIYSLGGTFYYLLTGKPPFPEGKTSEKLRYHLSKEPTPVRDLRPDVPDGLAAIVARMMAKDPAKRFQAPADVVEALTPWAAPAASEATATPKPNPAADPMARTPTPRTRTQTPLPGSETPAGVPTGRREKSKSSGVALGEVTPLPSNSDVLSRPGETAEPRPAGMSFAVIGAAAVAGLLAVGVIGWLILKVSAR